MPDSAQRSSYRCGAYTIAIATRRLLRDGREVELEAKVFDLILLLVSNHERAVGKREIVDALWGCRPVTDAALSQLIYKARRAFDDDGERQCTIRTIYGRGLQWVAPVEAATTTSPPSIDAPQAPTAVPSPTSPSMRAVAPAKPRTRFRRLWPAAGAAVVACIVLAGWLIQRGGAQHTPGLPRVALLPIENATGETTLDWVARGVPGLMGSLLDPSRGIDVIDPLQTARAWEYTPPDGESRIEHTRAVTHATIVVGGKLQKLADLYELTLHINPGRGYDGTDVSITGTEPGTLAVAALPQLRSALKLKTAMTLQLDARLQDAFFAQSFARGMDAAMHGNWADARPYFALVAKANPDFLPGRHRLGQAQIRTDQMEAAQATLQALLASAEQRNAPEIAAQALGELSYLAQLQHAFADAVKLAERGSAFAERARNPEIQVQLAIDKIQAEAGLKHGNAAAGLQKARALIDAHDLRQLRPKLYGAEIFAADSRNDFPALEKAARASLAANRAIGNERGSAAAMFNIAYAMENQLRRVEALPLWLQTLNWARDHQDDAMRIRAGWYVASALFNTGVVGRAAEINDAVLASARKQNDRHIQSLALQLRSGLEWMRDDAASALHTCREASALKDPDNDPPTTLNAWLAEVFIALTAEPAAVAGLARRADALVARQPDPSAYRFQQHLFHAARAATGGDDAGARTALEAAHAATSSGFETVTAQQFTLNVALVTGDTGVASLVLRDLDLARTDDAVLLSLIAKWAKQQENADLAQRVAQRRQALRSTALQAIEKVRPDTAPPAHAATGV